MARETSNLKLYLPEENEFYDVEKDQNENFEKLDNWSKNVNDTLGALELNKSNINHLHDDRYYTEAEIDAMFSRYCPYRVGDYLYTEDSTHPATRWLGTTWVRVVDRFLIGAGSKYSVGAQAGAEHVQLTINNLPSHTHSYSSSFNWNHTHSYSNSINLAHTHTWSGSLNWNHTHFYSNSINWSHSHSQVAHSHSQPTHQHAVPWGEKGVSFPFGTVTGSRLGTKAGHDWDNNWMLTEAGGNQNTGAAAPAINAAGGTTSFSGNTGASGTTSGISGTTSNAGTNTSFSGNTGNSGTTSTIGGTTAGTGSNQAFSVINPYRAVFIWRRTA
jgi:hypothetical protein